MFTPQEVREQSESFEKAVFGGYSVSAVDDFVGSLAEDYAALYKENAVLKSKMKVLVERLEEPYRSVFVAKALEERPYEELSAQYGKSESWARVTYHRAREKLRAMIEEGEK